MFKKLVVVGLCCLCTDVFGFMFWSNTVKEDEEVIFFPSMGYLNKKDKHWHINVHGWIFEPEFAGELRHLFRKATGIKKHKDDDQSIFKQRSAGFLVDNERGKRIKIKIGDKNYALSKRSAANGHFYGTIILDPKTIGRYAINNVLSFKAVLKHKDKRLFQGQAYLIPNHGTSIISDIDDTIKISNVHDKKELLKNTFYRPFKASPGMVDYYRLLLNLPDVAFHYVSASPWQLYQPLEEFRQDSKYPPGTFHMKLFRWKDRSITNLFASPIEYKLNIIEPILRQYPQRQFILIGDSGEKDPEVYGDVARRYPKQVKKILIRDVENGNIDNDRYKKAFHDLENKLWLVFKHPDEIP